MTRVDKLYYRLRILQARFAQPATYRTIMTAGTFLTGITGALLLIVIVTQQQVMTPLTFTAGIPFLLIVLSLNFVIASEKFYEKSLQRHREHLFFYLRVTGPLSSGDSTEHPLLVAWALLPLTLRRKKHLLVARVPLEQALIPEICLYTEEDLLIMEALYPKETA